MQLSSRTSRRLPCATTLGIAALAAVIGLASVAEPASARSKREDSPRSFKREEYVQSRDAAAPVMAIVSLRKQRVTVYDSEGWTMRARLPGRHRYETPAGIYSIRSAVEHYSTSMMTRPCRSAAADLVVHRLHAGQLPGYPASHGCVRMPSSFAERVFEVTRSACASCHARRHCAHTFRSPQAVQPWSEELSSRVATGPAWSRSMPSRSPSRRIGPAQACSGEAAEAELAARRLEDARRAARPSRMKQRLQIARCA